MTGINKLAVLCLLMGLPCLAVSCDDTENGIEDTAQPGAYIQGQPCQTETFVPTCDKGRLVTCISNQYVIEDCTGMGMCGAMADGLGLRCISTKYGKCSVENEISQYCEDIVNATVLRRIDCKRETLSGDLIYVADPNAFIKCDFGCNPNDLSICGDESTGHSQQPATSEAEAEAIITAYCRKNITTCHDNDHTNTYDACIEYEKKQQSEEYACDSKYQQNHLEYLQIITKQPCKGECTDADPGDYASMAECDASWDRRLTLLDVLMGACM